MQLSRIFGLTPSLRATLHRLRIILGLLGGLLVRFGINMGYFLGHLGLSWGFLGSYWVYLGLARSILEPC